MINMRITAVVLVVAVILNSVNCLQDCVTPRSTAGRCVPINQCPIILNIIKSNPNSEMRKHLEKYNCGYEGSYPKVCCEADAGSCSTTDQNPGVCVPIARCNPYLTILEQKPFLSDRNVNFLRRNECQFGSKARVCCPFIDKIKGEIKEEKNEKLPQPGECGVEELQDKILGGEKTGLSEYPWMALLEYGSYINPTLACGGSLISARFVITAAHCVIGPEVSRFGNLQRVRLGEYDINNVTDCINKIDYKDCAQPPQRIDVERIISHDGFNLRDRNKEHDIALVQMKRAVEFTEFIRPICLPPPYFNIPTQLHVAGWGKTETSSNSNIKLKLQLPQFDYNSCRAIYASLRFPVHLGQGQICAGGVIGKDSCTGDSGGPLMAVQLNSKYGSVWFQVGVVSFGPTPCGQNKPGVYTKVLQYLPWIHKTVTSTKIIE